MMRSAVGIALVFASSSLLAQNGTKSMPGVPVVQVNAGACPIGMQARQGVWDHTFTVHRDGREFKGPFGQRIFLTLVDAHQARITAATVRVLGLTGKNHMVQIDNAAAEDRNAARTLRITFDLSGNGSVTSDLYAPGFTSISSIELVEVSYADGTVWKISGSDVCRVTPDPLMLIAAQ
jgi:hypothetical protein